MRNNRYVNAYTQLKLMLRLKEHGINLNQLDSAGKAMVYESLLDLGLIEQGESELICITKKGTNLLSEIEIQFNMLTGAK